MLVLILANAGKKNFKKSVGSRAAFAVLIEEFGFLKHVIGFLFMKLLFAGCRVLSPGLKRSYFLIS